MNFNFYNGLFGLQQPREYHPVQAVEDTWPFWKRFKGCYLVKSTGIEGNIYFFRDIRIADNKRIGSSKKFREAARRLGLRSNHDYLIAAELDVVSRLQVLYKEDLIQYRAGRSGERISTSSGHNDSEKAVGESEQSHVASGESEEPYKASDDSSNSQQSDDESEESSNEEGTQSEDSESGGETGGESFHKGSTEVSDLADGKSEESNHSSSAGRKNSISSVLEPPNKKQLRLRPVKQLKIPKKKFYRQALF